MPKGMIHNNFEKLVRGFIFFLISILFVLIASSDSEPGAAVGQVTSIHGDMIELNIGSEKGIRTGDTGRIYYKVMIGEKEKPIFIAKFKVTHLSEKSSMAQIEEKTAEVKIGYLVEVTVKVGELEVKSKPSGAKVYMDGKEVGESPVVLSGVVPGRHQIRVIKEGYDPFEVTEVLGVERKEVIATLKKTVRGGDLIVQTAPPGATIYLDGKLVGTSPYDGKGLSPGTYRIRVIKEGFETWEGEALVEAGKRVEVLPKLKEMDWSKKSSEAPVWNIGDKWTYKGAAGKVWDTVVVDIKGNSFIVRPGERRDLDGYEMKTLNWNFLIKEGGEKTEYRGPFKSIFNFPIFVGKEWKYEAKSIPTGGSKEANFLNELKVERVEEVTVPAGTFKVYRIYYKQTHMPSARNGWICLWYSPVVKMWIKREVEKTSYWAKTTWLQDTELISYHLK